MQAIKIIISSCYYHYVSGADVIRVDKFNSRLFVVKLSQIQYVLSVHWLDYSYSIFVVVMRVITEVSSIYGKLYTNSLN